MRVITVSWQSGVERSLARTFAERFAILKFSAKRYATFQVRKLEACMIRLLVNFFCSLVRGPDNRKANSRQIPGSHGRLKYNQIDRKSGQYFKISYF